MLPLRLRRVEVFSLRALFWPILALREGHLWVEKATRECPLMAVSGLSLVDASSQRRLARESIQHGHLTKKKKGPSGPLSIFDMQTVDAYRRLR